MKILVDMDGVIANWGAQYDHDLDQIGEAAMWIPRTADQRTFDLNAGRSEAQQAVIAQVMARPGFYRELEPFPGAVEALKTMLAAGHEVEIVSSNWPDNPSCADDKIAWVREHLGKDWVRRVTLTHDKAAVRGDILIDDRPDIPGAEHTEWVQVLFDQPYNQHVDTFRILDWTTPVEAEGNWKSRLLQALAFARERETTEQTVRLEIDTAEVRKVSATGGEKGSKPQRYDLIPILPMDKLAELYSRGAEKYAAHNWRRGYDWSLSYAAAMRHLTRFWDGEDFDPEMGLPHPIAAVFHCFALVQFMEDFREFDDRFKRDAA